MAKYELTGTVKVLLDPVTFASGFTKREFVVTTDEDRYPQHVKFECVKDRVALLDNIKPDQRVTVTFDIRGNEYKGRYFVSLSAWKVEPEQKAGEPAADDEDGPPLESLQPPAQQDEENFPF
jgi:hypothetical protein